ncbi:MAG: hypothetical protein ACP6IP_03180 [Candidatus Njordarchaeia archaeon]
MGRRSLNEIVDNIIEGLYALQDEPFGVAELASAASIKYDTAKRMLDIMEKLYNAGFLIRVKERPRVFMWIPNRDMEDLMAQKFFQVLVLKETLTLRELVEDYGLDEEEGEKILKLLVDRGVAKWIDVDRVGVKKPSKYIRGLEEKKDRKAIEKTII